MQKKILSSLMLASICGIILSTAVFYFIQTFIAQNSADKISLARLADVEARMELNTQRLQELTEIVREENLNSARAVALLIEMEPAIIEDTAKLEEIAAALNIDEIDIIDSQGILRWGTQSFKYGQDFATSTQTRPFLSILYNPQLELAPEPMLSSAQGVMRQYAAVSLRHTRGIVQVGIIPHRLLEQQEQASTARLLSNVTLGEFGYVFAISQETGLISWHPKAELIGTWLPQELQEQGYLEIDGQRIRYHTRDTAEEKLVSAFLAKEIFEQRSFSSILFLIFSTGLFTMCCITINLFLRRQVISGIHSLLATLDEVAGGNLQATAGVHSNSEFSRLSEGINNMLTSIKSKIAEVSEAVSAAQEASKAKSSFLANMSHEIRTPMNGIIGMTDLLLGEKLSGHQLQYVKDIKNSAESLLSIINDILDLSKISEGKLQVNPVDMELGALLRNIGSMMSFSAHCKDLQYIEDIRLAKPSYIYADDVRLKQIIVNLLSNAIKFTKNGHVKLGAEISGDRLLFQVSDTGIGIKEEDIPIIFSAFEQVDQRKNRTIKGTGLGLSICKSLVELMDGQIWAESVYGQGATFHVSLPYVAGDENAISGGDDEFHYIHAPEARVLLVDDIQTNLTVGAGLLRLCGITADIALSGGEALALVQAQDYDLVFMDHMMPEMDGIETLNHIRALGEKYQHLPIIALTANAVTESRLYLLSSGMDDFLSKPIDKGALVNILQKWLPASKISLAAPSEASNLNTAYTPLLAEAARINGLDLEPALSRIGGLQDVLEASLKQLTLALPEGLQHMTASLQQEQLPAFALEAHGFKGALANIGATRAAELAAELESAAKEGNLLLCREKFPPFANVLELLGEDLQALFPAPKPQEKPAGSRQFLEEQARHALTLLEDFEATAALNCLDELLIYSFDEKIDSLLQEAENAALAFSYEKAAQVLKKIWEE